MGANKARKKLQTDKGKETRAVGDMTKGLRAEQGRDGAERKW